MAVLADALGSHRVVLEKVPRQPDSQERTNKLVPGARAPLPEAEPTQSFRVPGFQTLSEARSLPYQCRILRPRRNFSAFFELYIFPYFSFAPLLISPIFQDLCTIFSKFHAFFAKFQKRSKETADFAKFYQNFTEFLRDFTEFQCF